ncbi:MAG: beta-lactamase family protein [Aquisalinus sp.]|nr:beta-lactamase family protein [Aquisalinus sp.]
MMDDVLRDAVSAGRIPGVVAHAANRDGVFYQGAFGKRSLDADAEMTNDTVFKIFSMTKAVATTAAVQLIERGELSLDTPVEEILPEWKDKVVLEGFDGDIPITRAPRTTATVRHLATHTSGMAYEFWNADVGKYLEATGVPSILSFDRGLLGYPMVSDPGTKWEYSPGIDWLGALVEEISGKSLRDFCKENLFEPLGMNDTDFQATDEMRTRMAKIHQRDESGGLTAIDLDLPPEPGMYCGGHGLYSTAGDYLKYLQALLKGGTHNGVQVLKPETVAMMTENHIGDLNVGMMHSAIPPLTNDIEFFPGMPKKHNLGFLMNMEREPGMRHAGSHCWAGLANTYFWWDPSAGIAAVILHQILPFADVEAIDVFRNYEKAVYASLG